MTTDSESYLAEDKIRTWSCGGVASVIFDLIFDLVASQLEGILLGLLAEVK
jgi:hypothetical protein